MRYRTLMDNTRDSDSVSLSPLTVDGEGYAAFFAWCARQGIQPMNPHQYVVWSNRKFNKYMNDQMGKTRDPNRTVGGPESPTLF